MACPNCGCKVTYKYGNDDNYDGEINLDALERCAACGEIFDVEMSIDDDDFSAEVTE